MSAWHMVGTQQIPTGWWWRLCLALVTMSLPRSLVSFLSLPSCSLAQIAFFSSVQSCPTLCDPMNCSTPGLPIHHQLPESTQTHVHWVGDAIQPSHPLSSPSPPALNLSQHQGLFKWVSSSHQVAKVLEFQLQHHSFQWTPSTDLLWDRLVVSPCSPRDSWESSPTPQFVSSSLNFWYGKTRNYKTPRGKHRQNTLT